MGNIFNYLEDIQYDSIYDQPFTELDILLLTVITYLNYNTIVTDGLDLQKASRLTDVPQYMPQENSMMNTKHRLALLQQAASVKRYKNIKLMGYVNDIDLDVQKQFAAMTYKIDLDTFVIAFRGTDDSIIGWKEDFHMTYMEHVPAQQTAVRYVQKVMQAFPTATFILTGHSKGGNLATYASSQVEPSLQDRIKQIYSFDAPGLNHTIIETEGYQSIASKIKRYIPQGSIVGMMLETPKQAHIVKSVAIGGIAQHDTFSWQIENEHFILLDTLNPDSIQTDKTLKEWVETVPDDELKDFFDIFFGLILDAQITSIDEFFQPNSIKKVLTIVQNAHALTEQEKEMLNRLTRLLISIRYQAWIDDFKTPNPATFMTDMRGNWASLTERFSFLNKDE
ncbi:DUF2974 domain-containing protein [Streptococcus anginosus]|uniref:DUF2974 domain-containing protein n=1 Tax=Streptococcus anginosus TaxID=1328 RepID=UPI0022DF87B5|nr:DUF2974 domain-containing protein [Streptococcus anginosus]